MKNKIPIDGDNVASVKVINVRTRGGMEAVNFVDPSFCPFNPSN